MGLRSFLKYFFICLLELCLLFLLIVYIPFLPPDAKISTPYKVEYPKELAGKLMLNQKLNDVQLWHENEVFGPEAFADYNGELYASLDSGHIVKFTDNHITPIVMFGKPCKEKFEAPLCGRPLGLHFDSAGNLYAADAYYGIFIVNVETGAKQQIISMEKEIGGRKPKLINSLVIADNNDIYFTDSSTEFPLHDGLYDMLADGSGRLIKYDAKTKTTKVLVDQLHFANGIAFSANKDFVIVAETARNRIHRYYISGPNVHVHDIFIDKLPGMPDNLKGDGQGGFIVPLVTAVDADNPSIGQILGPFPKMRRLIARLFAITELFFVKINQIYPNNFCAQAAYTIGHFTSTNFFLPSRVTILHISGTGEVLDSLHADNKKIAGISEAHVFKDVLYLGSPFNPYIGVIALKTVGWSKFQKTSTVKIPSTTTQKPTTSSPKTTPPPPTTTASSKTNPPTTTSAPKTTSPPLTTTSAPKTASPPPPPTTTSAPKTTQKPTTTTIPSTTTSAPKTTPPPTITSAPKTTQKPITTTTPSTTTSAPKTTPPPTTTSSPKSTEKPTTTPPPLTTSAPKTTQKPTTTSTIPSTSTTPTPAPKPSASTAKPVASKP